MSTDHDYHTAVMARKLIGLAHAGIHGEVQSIIIAFSISLVVLFLGVSTYRVIFHPLAKYPGPFLRKISSWPEARSAWSGHQHLDLYKLHMTYGNVVRVGPNSLSFKSSEAFRQLHADRNANVIKAGPMGFNRDVFPVKSMIGMDDKHEHAQRRKLVSHAFSEKALSQSESLMIEKIDQWTDVLGPSSADKENGWSSARNMADWCNMLALDVISKLCFGEDYGAIKAGHTNVHPTLIQGAKLGQVTAYSELTPIFKMIMRNPTFTKILMPGLYKLQWSFRLLTMQMLKKRNQIELDAEASGEETQHDFFHYIFKAKDDTTGERLPVEKFQSEASLLVAAGSDTTSTALSSLLFYLNKNPETKAKLNAEIRAAFNDVNEIRTGPQLNSLHYLRACIDEALRLNPPVPGGMHRTVLANGIILDGEHIPEGTQVNVSLYGLHRDERYFADAHKFIPERWIAGSKTATFENSDELLKRSRNAFNPFSAGLRNCAGKNMAYQEMSIAMARLLFLYDMRFSSAPGAVTGGGSAENKIPGLETEDDFCFQDYFITTKNGPFLEYKRRETAN